jgi:hypothetical protein
LDFDLTYEGKEAAKAEQRCWSSLDSNGLPLSAIKYIDLEEHLLKNNLDDEGEKSRKMEQRI